MHRYSLGKSPVNMWDDADSGAGVRAYFLEHIPALRRQELVRVTNTLIRGGIDTMEALLAAPDEEIRRIRQLGDKSFAIAVTMRDMYAAEKAKAGTSGGGGK